MSFDDAEKLSAWAAKEGFQYEVWSDASRELALHYGAASSASAGSPSRITVLLDERGDVKLEYRKVSVGAHPADVLEDCRALFGK